MKERVGDGKLIIISMTVSGINDRIRFHSYDTRCYFNVTYRIVSAQTFKLLGLLSVSELQCKLDYIKFHNVGNRRR